MDLGIPGLDRIEQIGRGGSGVVYRGWQAEFGRWVAVKVFPADEDARRLERERLAVGRLSDHPGIVPVFGGGVTADGRPYLVMVYMDGGSLADQVARRGPLPVDAAVSCVLAMASALQVAHEQGIWHRDIKPANILYDRFGSPRLADFGIAHLSDGAFRTATGRISGTASYMAPELLDGRPFTAAADVFSLGLTLYYALAGHDFYQPLPAESYQAFLVRRLTHPVQPDLPETVPGWLRDVVRAATAPDPVARIPTAAALREALNRTGRWDSSSHPHPHPRSRFRFRFRFRRCPPRCPCPPGSNRVPGWLTRGQRPRVSQPGRGSPDGGSPPRPLPWPACYSGSAPSPAWDGG